jgi:hypothetical protein
MALQLDGDDLALPSQLVKELDCHADQTEASVHDHQGGAAVAAALPVHLQATDGNVPRHWLLEHASPP